MGNAILSVMTAQIVTSAAIDHLGLFGMTIRPMTIVRATGVAFLLVGLAIPQLAGAGPQKAT